MWIEYYFMKPLWVVGLTVLMLILWPLRADAAATRVYVNLGVGGAMIVGGGVLFWHLTYASKISQKQGDPSHRSTLTFLRIESNEEGFKLLGRSFLRSPPLEQPFVFEVPLFVLRW